MGPLGCRQPSEAALAPRGGGRPVGKAKMCPVRNNPPGSPKHPPTKRFCATYGGSPPVSSASFLREPSLPARGGQMWNLGLVKDKMWLVGWGRESAEGIHPPPTCPAAGPGAVCYSHSRCYRPRCRPALPPHRSPGEGHSHGAPVRDNPKNPHHQTWLWAPPQTHPTGITELVGDAGSSREVYSLTSH